MRSAVILNLLLSIAWIGELDKSQVHALHFPDKSLKTVETTLTALAKDGLIESRPHYTTQRIMRGGKLVEAPKPMPALWHLTPAGHAVVRPSPQYPVKAARVRSAKLIGHDYRTAQAVIALILLARRYGLSGAAVTFELRLDPDEKRPVMDALLFLHTGGTAQPAGMVPWSKDVALSDETWWRFAIESDNHTEPKAVIAGKGVAYRKIYNDPVWRRWWHQTNGPMPYVIWVAEEQQRLEEIHAAFVSTWPDGQWLLTTDAGLAANSWINYEKQAIKADLSISMRPRQGPAAPAPRLPAALPAPAPPAALPPPQSAPAAPPQPAPAAPQPQPAAPGATVAPPAVSAHRSPQRRSQWWIRRT